MSYLPIGIQTFRDIRANDYVYVDKTGIIADLVRPGKGAYFLTRPRRFGKSLLISTLASLFRGERDLFEGLDIAQTEVAFSEHPVLVFDFSIVPHDDAATLNKGLLYELDRMAEQQGLALPETPLQQRFRALIEALAKTGKVVILIDEYDKPITEHLGNPDLAEGCRDVLRRFFSVVKGADAMLRFVFITGITRFSKVTLFSEMNHLNDISTDDRYAALLGLTEAEIDHALGDQIDAWANKEQKSPEALRDEIREMYNGYRFTEAEHRVYNPWSLLNALEKKKFQNYWFDSGGSRFLMELLERHIAATPTFSMADLYHYEIDSDQLPSFDIRELDLETILFQAGYLTITDHEDTTFHLGFPNRDVEASLLHVMLTYLTIRNQNHTSKIVKALRKALAARDLDAFFEILRTRLFANIPYDIQLNNERYYQTILHTALLLSGMDTDVEVRTNLGRIDLVLETRDTLYIFELKMSPTADTALAQIEAKTYAEKYASSGKKLIGVGVAIADRTIAEWATVSLS